MHVGDTILAAAAEAIIYEHLFLLKNKSTYNALYLTNIRDPPDGQYLHVHYNAGVTYTNNAGDLPVYSNPVW